ncbi:hypothetical protein ACHAXA_009990 [Cyclostephanos tholiformis]|uniref:VanZ-like domain-containing protein n=1 Tax=Cyclostephanos tholiformis TaxID=382380 RepID=A0ABD3RCJ5_9STRA
MLIAGEDKLYHALASAFITCLTFALTFLASERFYHRRLRNRTSGGEGNNDDVEVGGSSSPSIMHGDDGLGENNCLRFPRDRPRWYYPILMALSAFVALAIGITKEVFDAYDVVWTGGDASLGDVLADSVGAIMGILLIFVALRIRPCISRIAMRVRDVRARASDEPAARPQ